MLFHKQLYDTASMTDAAYSRVFSRPHPIGNFLIEIDVAWKYSPTIAKTK